MRYMKPDYYDSFRCMAGKCPATCCAGWQIMIDEGALEKYAADKSSFSGRLLNGIDWQEESFDQYDGRCSMLNEDNLCDLVIQKGEDWLCETCSRYPRHVEEFDGLREWSLSLSCPVAAEMILSREEPLRFLTEEDNEKDPLEKEFEDFDFLLFTQLEDARGVMFSIVQNRTIPIRQRMGIIMEMARRMQCCVDEERLFDMDEVIQSFADVMSGTINDGARNVIEEVPFQDLKKGLGMLTRLERLRDDWTEVLTLTEKTLYVKGEEAYRDIYEAFCREYIGQGESLAKWEIFQEQLLMFFLYTYFCGAVYDECIYSKVALGVFSVYSIREFIMCEWYLADKYIDKAECVRLAYRYAREVEHSDENLNQLEEWLFETM